jgi:hypothetical protein
LYCQIGQRPPVVFGLVVAERNVFVLFGGELGNGNHQGPDFDDLKISEK